MLVNAPVGVGILRWKVNQTAEEGKCVAACRFRVSNIPRVQAADPTGPNEGSFRLDRGGSWRDEAADCRSAMGWKNSNLRTEMTRLLRRAGVSGWPRLFHSMRASRQTELQREFPLHVVCLWLGNSPRIAQQSYLLVTEDDFARAAGVAKVTVEGGS